MDLSEIIPHIEALIFASDKPLTTHDIVELINSAFAFMEERISVEQVEAAVEGIQEKYNAEFYPFEVRESGGGWQFLTKKEFHQTVGQLNGDKFLKRLSNAALETLAIIAYKQPITKGEVESIRGVNSDYSIQKLLEKELIVISGRNENLPGKPLVYATSKAFMDYFGINNTNDLPKIKEVLAEQLIEATVVNSAMNAHEDQAYKDANPTDKPKAQRELFVEGTQPQTGELAEEMPEEASGNKTGETPEMDASEVQLEVTIESQEKDRQSQNYMQNEPGTSPAEESTFEDNDPFEVSQPADLARPSEPLHEPTPEEEGVYQAEGTIDNQSPTTPSLPENNIQGDTALPPTVSNENEQHDRK